MLWKAAATRTIRRACAPHACSSAPPSVLAKVTSMQSLRARRAAGQRERAEPERAPSTTQLSSTATIVFSRRPQRSGSDSRRDWSSMIIAGKATAASREEATPRA